MKNTVGLSGALIFALTIICALPSFSDDSTDAANNKTEGAKTETRSEGESAAKFSAKTETDSKSIGKDKEQIQAWFAQYDEIRRGAEMTLSEKLQAHSLFSKGLDAEPNSKEFDKSAKFATDMMARYTEAGTKIKGLPELAPTADLQKEYEEYFTQGTNMFRDYLQYQKESGDKKENKAKLMAKKDKLTAQVPKMKATDAKLRSKYGVKPHKHK